MSHRNLDHLHRRKIIYRSFPTTDKPSKVFQWGYFYEEGTYQCYDLFRSKAKITSYKSLRWHLLVLWHLNPKLQPGDFENLSDFISNKDNGFSTFTAPPHVLKNIVYDVSMCDLNESPKNKIRKVIFKDSSGLSTQEKLKIVGELIGKSKKVCDGDIYECMLEINHSNERITISSLAKYLGCSSRTIHRNMSPELKKEKELLNYQNEEIQC